MLPSNARKLNPFLIEREPSLANRIANGEMTLSGGMRLWLRACIHVCMCVRKRASI